MASYLSNYGTSLLGVNARLGINVSPNVNFSLLAGLGAAKVSNGYNGGLSTSGSFNTASFGVGMGVYATPNLEFKIDLIDIITNTINNPASSNTISDGNGGQTVTSASASTMSLNIMQIRTGLVYYF